MIRLRLPARLALTGLVLALAGAAPLAAQAVTPPTPATPAGSADDRALLQAGLRHRSVGADTAPVIVYVFVDYACPDCRDFTASRLDSLERAVVRPGRARLIHAVFPIPRLLRGWQAATAAACIAALTDGPTFMEAHRRIFSEQDRWAVARDAGPAMRVIARDVGADPGRFDDCITRDVMVPLLLADVRAGHAARVAGTPTLVVLPARALADRGRDPFTDAIVVPGDAPFATILGAIERAGRGR